MPTFEITAPDGRKFRVTGETAEGAFQALQSHLGQGGNQPEMRSYEPTLTDRARDFANSMGLPGQRMASDLTGLLGSGVQGAAQAMTFGLSDEIEAGLKTGFGLMGDYGQELDRVRGRMEYNRAVAPTPELIGNLAGGVTLGSGMMRAGASFLPGAANAPLSGRVAAGIKEGAAYGGAYGFGTGEGVADRLTSGAIGAATGGAIGGAIPAVGAGISKLKETVGDRVMPFINAARDPQGEAARRTAEVMARDTRRAAITPYDEPYARLNNQTILNVDRGGETTRALARSVANQSPPAREAIGEIVDQRFATQNLRTTGLIDRIMNNRVDDVAYSDALKETARKVNRPRYQAAYAKGSVIQTTPEMERLMSSPDMVAAMREVATGGGQSRAVAEGFGAFNPRVRVTDDGRIQFLPKTAQNNAFPDLQYWDYVKRELDGMIGTARSSGNAERAGYLTNIKNSLVRELDAQVPIYKVAREGAAMFFQAEDALEAGKNFVTLNKDIGKAMSAMQRFNPAEREAFKLGFASRLREMVNNSRDRNNVLNSIFQSPNARQKVRAVLGQEGYTEFEVFTRVEAAQDRLRNALTGNSTTMRQMAEIGLGGTAGAYSGGDVASFFTGAALTRIVSELGGKLVQKHNQKVMENIADILLSTDPAKIQQGVKQIAKNQASRRAFDDMRKVIEQRLIAPASAQGTAVTTGG